MFVIVAYNKSRVYCPTVVDFELQLMLDLGVKIVYGKALGRGILCGKVREFTLYVYEEADCVWDGKARGSLDLLQRNCGCLDLSDGHALVCRFHTVVSKGRRIRGHLCGDWLAGAKGNSRLPGSR